MKNRMMSLVMTSGALAAISLAIGACGSDSSTGGDKQYSSSPTSGRPSSPSTPQKPTASYSGVAGSCTITTSGITAGCIEYRYSGLTSSDPALELASDVRKGCNGVSGGVFSSLKCSQVAIVGACTTTQQAKLLSNETVTLKSILISYSPLTSSSAQAGCKAPGVFTYTAP
jgi:hypothetical protein